LLQSLKGRTAVIRTKTPADTKYVEFVCDTKLNNDGPIETYPMG